MSFLAKAINNGKNGVLTFRFRKVSDKFIAMSSQCLAGIDNGCNNPALNRVQIIKYSSNTAIYSFADHCCPTSDPRSKNSNVLCLRSTISRRFCVWSVTLNLSKEVVLGILRISGYSMIQRP